MFFVWSFLPANLAKKTTQKNIFRSAEGEQGLFASVLHISPSL